MGGGGGGSGMARNFIRSLQWMEQPSFVLVFWNPLRATRRVIKGSQSIHTNV